MSNKEPILRVVKFNFLAKITDMTGSISVETTNGPGNYLNATLDGGTIHLCIIGWGLTNPIGGVSVERKSSIFTYFGWYLAKPKDFGQHYIKKLRLLKS